MAIRLLTRARFASLLFLATASLLVAAERKVDPTFLHRYIPDIPAGPSAFTSDTCRYQPIFGQGDSEPRVPRGVARVGQITVDPGGSSKTADFATEEGVVVVLEGGGTLTYGEEKHPLKKNDYFYIPPAKAYALAAGSGGPLRVVVYGYRIPGNMQVTPPDKLQIANIDDVKLEVVGGHPPSTLFRLLMGDTKSTRDKIAAGNVLTSLFIMEFAPGGTNFPHHHEMEEEVYIVLDGAGEIVAGPGMNGVEGRFKARPGDAYFYRLNTTVGFYASQDPNVKSRILAARSRFPFRRFR